MLKSVKLSLASILLGTMGMVSLSTASFASIDVATPQQSVVHGVSHQATLISKEVKKSKKVKGKKVKASKKTTSMKPQVKSSPAAVTPSTGSKQPESKPAETKK